MELPLGISPVHIYCMLYTVNIIFFVLYCCRHLIVEIWVVVASLPLLH